MSPEWFLQGTENVRVTGSQIWRVWGWGKSCHFSVLMVDLAVWTRALSCRKRGRLLPGLFSGRISWAICKKIAIISCVDRSSGRTVDVNHTGRDSTQSLRSPHFLARMVCRKGHRRPKNSSLRQIVRTIWNSGGKIITKSRLQPLSGSGWCFTFLKQKRQNTSPVTIR